nr:HlyD family efflux transporter periplasmic adaptor subunit [Lysobacter chinensis]
MATLASAVILAAALVVAFGGYTRKAPASGRLVPVGGLPDIAAAAPGVVTRLLVTEGETVEAGQPLIEISPDIDVPDAGGAVGERIAIELEQQRQRLRQDLEDLEAMQRQQAAALQQRIHAQRRHLASAEAELALRRRQVAATERMLERIEPLREQRIVSDLQVQEYQDQALNAKAQLELAARNRLDAETALAEARERREALPLETAALRSDIEGALSEIAQSAARNLARQAVLVRAPEAGVASGLAVDRGQAVREGQRLLSIVPARAQLQAELWAPSRAIGTIAPGNRVAMRFDAFPYQTFGQQYGRIVGIANSPLSADEVRARTGIDPGEPAFRVLVALQGQQIDGADGALPLRAGMSLEADLLLERRRLHRLLFAPLDTFRAAPPAEPPPQEQAP